MSLFKQELKGFKKFTPRTVKTKKKRKIAYKSAKELYRKLLSIYHNDYNDISDEEKERMDEKYNPKNLLIKFIADEKKVNNSQKKLLLKK